MSEEGVHSKVSFTVTSAKLQNANNEYVSTNQNTFTYDPALGKWVTGNDIENLQGAEIRITLPDYDLSTDVVDPLTSQLRSSIDAVDNATIAWNGSPATVITGITANAAGTSIPVTYVPTNIAGEYEGLININNGVYHQRVIVIEDYTPRFSAIEEWNTSSYLGYSSKINAEIVPEANNVAGILSGQYASTWGYEITGEHADEFTLVWVEGENKLSAAEIVFKPKTAGNKTALLSLTCSYTDAANVMHTTCVQVPLKAQVADLALNTLAFADGVESIVISSESQPLFKKINSSEAITISPETNDVVTIEKIDEQFKITPKALGSVTITATQEADLANGIAATTITKTISVTEDIVWNWERLYFGSVNKYPVTASGDWNLELAGTIDFIKDGLPDRDKNGDGDPDVDATETDPIINGDPHAVVTALDAVVDGDYQVTLANWEEGETYVWFKVEYNGQDNYFKSQVYRDPRYLPLNVNDDRIYEAVTDAFDKASYSDAIVTFDVSNNQTASWTFGFKGIPDLLSFTANGDNNWQIEESNNGVNWSIAYTWAPIQEGVPFELVLQPATRYVRISYSIGVNSEGTLSNIAVSELKSARVDIDKLYMPIVGADESTTKNVVFTYVSEDGYELVKSHGEFTTDPENLEGTNAEPYYQIQRVAVTSTAKEELLGSVNVKGTDATVTIQTFEYPQSIPVQLASDHQDRYYYITSEAYKTTWNVDERAVVMQHAVADASPYVVFHFTESPAPGIISFNFPATAKGTWKVEERTDNTNWKLLTPSTAQNLAAGSLIQEFHLPTPEDPASTYVKVT